MEYEFLFAGIECHDHFTGERFGANREVRDRRYAEPYFLFTAHDGNEGPSERLGPYAEFKAGHNEPSGQSHSSFGPRGTVVAKANENGALLVVTGVESDNDENTEKVTNAVALAIGLGAGAVFTAMTSGAGAPAALSVKTVAKTAAKPLIKEIVKAISKSALANDDDHIDTDILYFPPAVLERLATSTSKYNEKTEGRYNVSIDLKSRVHGHYTVYLWVQRKDAERLPEQLHLVRTVNDAIHVREVTTPLEQPTMGSGFDEKLAIGSIYRNEKKVISFFKDGTTANEEILRDHDLNQDILLFGPFVHAHGRNPILIGYNTQTGTMTASALLTTHVVGGSSWRGWKIVGRANPGSGYTHLIPGRFTSRSVENGCADILMYNWNTGAHQIFQWRDFDASSQWNTNFNWWRNWDLVVPMSMGSRREFHDGLLLYRKGDPFDASVPPSCQLYQFSGDAQMQKLSDCKLTGDWDIGFQTENMGTDVTVVNYAEGKIRTIEAVEGKQLSSYDFGRPIQHVTPMHEENLMVESLLIWAKHPQV